MMMILEAKLLQILAVMSLQNQKYCFRFCIEEEAKINENEYNILLHILNLIF
jgi:hypothetical protein